MRKSVKVLSLFTVAVLVLACLVMVVPSIMQLYPSLIGADCSYTVLGGSMQSALCPGDLVFTKKVEAAEIQVGDIIAVQAERGVYTHRVADKVDSDDGFLFQTKGDANEAPDSRYVKESEVVGKAVCVIPFRHLYAPYAYAALVFAPFCLLAGKQFTKMYQFLNRYKRRIVRRRGLKARLQRLTGIERGRRLRKIQVLDTTSFLLLAIIVASSTRMVAPRFLGGGYSYYSDVESTSSRITADAWQVPSTITCNVSPTTVNLGENVTTSGVINPPRTVQIEFKLNGTVYGPFSVPTDDSGAYSYVFTPNEAGNWTVKVSWPGDSSYYGASCQATVQVLG